MDPLEEVNDARAKLILMVFQLFVHDYDHCYFEAPFLRDVFLVAMEVDLLGAYEMMTTVQHLN